MAPKTALTNKRARRTSTQIDAVAGNSSQNIKNAIAYQQSDDFIMEAHHTHYLMAINGKMAEGEWTHGRPVCHHCNKELGCHRQTWRGKIAVNLTATNTEFPIEVDWKDGNKPEPFTIAEFKQKCIVLWDPIEECNPPPHIQDKAYRKSNSKSSSKSSSKASNEIQKGEVKKHRKTGRTVIKKVTPNIKRPSNRMQS